MKELIEVAHIASIRNCLAWIRSESSRDVDLIDLVVKAVGRKRLMVWLKTHPPS